MLARGYTLLELLIVLALLGLLVGIALPRFMQLYSSGVHAYEKEDIVAQLSSLGYQAYVKGMDYTLSNHSSNAGDEALILPDGWVLETNAPITYKKNGVCTGGELIVRNAGHAYKVMLTPPLCDPELI